MPPLQLVLPPPKQVLIFSATLLFALVVSCVWLMWDAPWLGVRLTATESGAVQIRQVQGPAAQSGLRAGDTLLALRAASGETLPLTSADLLEEPDFHTAYADYNAFLRKQQALGQTLASARVGLVAGDGNTVWLSPTKRPPQDIPFMFWFQIACGSVAWLVGASVFAYRQRDAAAQLYALTGAAFALVTFTAAVYSGRELALEGGLFRLLSVLDHAGAFLFSAAFVSLLWVYPSRLGDPRLIRAIFLLYLAVWLGDTWQWSGDMNFGIRYPILLGLAASFVFSAMQWRNSRADPIDRAALKWFLLTLLLGSAVFVFGVFGMEAAGYMPVIAQGYSFGLVLMMYLGMALGMKRYRLFNLEPWWPEVWLWLLGGAMVVAFDIVLAHALTQNGDLAFASALALAGWIYFPLRQWLLRRVGGARDGRLPTLLPDLLEIAATPIPAAELRRRWHQLLNRAYAPQSLDEGALAARQAKVADHGLRLIVPGLGANPALILGYADGGKRLFQQADAELAQALWQLLSQVLAKQDAYIRGAQEERERIAKDLHDDIGAQLLTLIHRSESAQSTELLRILMRDLRSLAASLDRQPAPLADALGDMRGEIESRCEAAEVALDWLDRLPPARDYTVNARQRLALERVLREAITNALKHARPQRVAVGLREDGNDLSIRVRDDGCGFSNVGAGGGRGLHNMAARMEEVGGTALVKSAAPHGCVVEIRLPLAKLKG